MEMKTRELRAELEEAGQLETKDNGARGATDEAKGEGGGRSISTEDSGEHREESAEGKYG